MAVHLLSVAEVCQKQGYFKSFYGRILLKKIISEILNKMSVVLLEQICFNKDIDDIGKMVDKEELLTIYEDKIRSFGTFEQIVELRELFQMLLHACYECISNGLIAVPSFE